MTTTVRTQAEIAEAIARLAHTDQVEKYGGGPYAGHLERVVALLGDVPGPGVDAADDQQFRFHAEHALDLERAVAWLHDILEDCRDWTEEKLLHEGVDLVVVQAVRVLTKLYDETYDDYIHEILKSGNRLAIRVKLADLEDHLRPDCPPIPDRLRLRYEKALITMGARA